MLELREARTPSEVDAVASLFREYASSLGVDLGFQGFEEELAQLPGPYAPPGGRLLLARARGEDAGCGGIRPLGTDTCELKRLYVRPAFRGSGAGRALAEALVEAARSAGYARVRLDTLPDMDAARALYGSLGFREIEPYRFNPIEGTAYMELDLTALG